MAYFSNGTEGMVFDLQCERCKYGKKACPIAYVQIIYNYESCNNKIASNILDKLVQNDGVCTMFNEFKLDFEIDPNQLELEL